MRGMLFGGFRKCLYPIQKFDSDPERRFAVILEDDKEVLKWFKPNKGVFQIHYTQDDDAYEPDFVAETKTQKFMCEPKRVSEMTDDIVRAKAKAAALWCKHATDTGDKPWTYLLIPHDKMRQRQDPCGVSGRVCLASE